MREITELVASLRPLLKAGAPLRAALLFGSAAHGRLRPDSDLDIGIIPEDPNLPLAFELEIAARLSAATGREVDVVRLDRASPLVRWEAARAHVPLLSEPSSALADFVAQAALEHADMAPLLSDASERLRRRLAGAVMWRSRVPGSTEGG